VTGMEQIKKGEVSEQKKRFSFESANTNCEIEWL